MYCESHGNIYSHTCTSVLNYNANKCAISINHSPSPTLYVLHTCIYIVQGHIKKFCETIRQDTPSAKEDVTVYKAAIWALGHIGSTQQGLELLLREGAVDDLIELAEECPLLSIRGWGFCE